MKNTHLNSSTRPPPTPPLIEWGHIGISVPSLEAAVKFFDKKCVKFVKRPEDGTMREIAFIQDVDGYWIEVIEAKLMRAYAAGE